MKRGNFLEIEGFLVKEKLFTTVYQIYSKIIVNKEFLT